VAGIDDITERMTDAVNTTFGRPLSLTRGAVTIEFSGILDLDARVTPISPTDVPIEGVKPRLDVKIDNLGALGRPQHSDQIHDAVAGQDFEVVEVEDGARGCVSCWLLEVTL
jgi:hypothetical protein